MIGRRIVHHLKQQHWTGVFIELVIVILGVFIGLQVDNWNQQRQGHALEQQYLQRLHDDMKLSIETADYNIRDMRRQYRLEGDMLDALKSCRLEGAANIRFVAGAYALGKMDPPPLVRGTLDELRSTGRIGLIHDVHLRVQLARLVEDSNTFGRIFPMIMTRANPSIFYVNQRVQLNIPPGEERVHDHSEARSASRQRPVRFPGPVQGPPVCRRHFQRAGAHAGSDRHEPAKTSELQEAVAGHRQGSVRNEGHLT